MAKVIAPNKEYSGISAGVTFQNGEGICEESRLLDWFEQRGYQIIHEGEGKTAALPKTARKGK